PSPRLHGGSDTTGWRSKNQGTITRDPTPRASPTAQVHGNPVLASSRPMVCVVAAPLAGSNDSTAHPVNGWTSVGTWSFPAPMAGLAPPQQAPAFQRGPPLARSSVVPCEPATTNTAPRSMTASCAGPLPAEAVHFTPRFATLAAVTV